MYDLKRKVLPYSDSYRVVNAGSDSPPLLERSLPHPPHPHNLLCHILHILHASLALSDTSVFRRRVLHKNVMAVVERYSKGAAEDLRTSVVRCRDPPTNQEKTANTAIANTNESVQPGPTRKAKLDLLHRSKTGSPANRKAKSNRKGGLENSDRLIDASLLILLDLIHTQHSV